MKNKLVTLVALVLMSFFAATTASAQGVEPAPKNSFAATNTMIITCMKSAYPGGMSCSQPSELNKTWQDAELNSYLTSSLGCVGTDTTVYSCKKNGLNGQIMYWIFTSTGMVSTILYIPWQINS